MYYHRYAKRHKTGDAEHDSATACTACSHSCDGVSAEAQSRHYALGQFTAVSGFHQQVVAKPENTASTFCCCCQT
jgi:hypothetical protein